MMHRTWYLLHMSRGDVQRKAVMVHLLANPLHSSGSLVHWASLMM
jgi:hypothetical protein